MTTRVLRSLVLACVAAALASVHAASDVKLTKREDRVRVEIGGQLFTEYVLRGGPFPYLYPVLAADGTQLNRDFPMKTVDGEENDHTHHRSLWFTHGAVNGIDFWTDVPKRGNIVNDTASATTSGAVGTIQSHNRWVGPDGNLTCTDDTTIKFRAIPSGRLIDYEVTIHAQPDQPLVFGDTKEGSFAFRVAQWMTPTHNFKGKKVEGGGHIVNDAGLRDGAAWGKHAAWVDFFAPKDGKVYGVAIFDNPQNPRYPTWWHVRDYGLFAANPFGQRDFEPEQKHPAGKGNLTVPAGGSVTFRYRCYFHLGDEKTAGVAERCAEYVAGK
jgi:hypothetical protein